MVEFLGPAVPPRAVPPLHHRFGERLEQRMEIKRLATLEHKALEAFAIGVLAARVENAEQDSERFLLEGRHLLVVHEPGFADVVRRLECVFHTGVAGRLVDGDVERVQGPSRRGGKRGSIGRAPLGIARGAD